MPIIWPGPDLRRLPGATDASVAYGMIPPSLFATIRDRFLALVNSRNARRVPRTYPGAGQWHKPMPLHVHAMMPLCHYTGIIAYA
jgi:hypothetical protein